jgi:phosphoenolpyruvate carboxylase
MDDGSDYDKAAAKFMENYRKVELMHERGKIAGKKYEGYRLKLLKRLSELRRMRLEYVRERLETIERNLNDIDKPDSGFTGRAHMRRSMDLREEKETYSAELKMLEGASEDEFFEVLKVTFGKR